ncbi:MAG: sigma 54-interacting transcriptional regulator [Myxococcota bacterium]|nr:sigma 54-interacting transcriptional regulator [Myxococcota bacterium]
MSTDFTTLFPLIFDSINDGVFTVDEAFCITSFNAAAERIIGMKREDAIGKKCHEVFRAGICQSGCALRETLQSGTPKRDVRVDVINAKMEGVPIRVSTAVLRNKRGKLIGGVEIFRDVSDVETLRNELRGRHRFMDMVGESDVMRELYAIIPQIAESETPVLIDGPSGTGKELVAQAIHDLSLRKEKPFVRVNCGALPDTLLESELFGYMRGAFTGATYNKPGRFQQAHGGTLFLDEIGDVSPAFQVKLLRAIEEGEIQPLGATRAIRIDVRLITATNRDLAAMVKNEQFREDLYYRIKVIPIALPRLSERRKDIPLLIDHFAKALSARSGRTPPTMSKKALRALYDYDYPGNVRELRNIIERAFVLCAGSVIDLQHLPPEVVAARLESGFKTGRLHARPSESRIAVAEAMPRDRLPAALPEKQRLLDILDAHGWHRTEVAKELGIGRTTLWRRMKDYGLV